MNVQMNLSLTSDHAQLTDQTGAALAPEGIPFQVLPSDFELNPSAAQAPAMFPAPDARVIDVYASGVR
jgi:hypothetical protein